MARLLAAVLTCWLLPLILSGRPGAPCPDNQQLTSEISRIEEATDRKEVIRNLGQLLIRKRKCGQPPDSSLAGLLHALGRAYWYDYQLDSAVFYTRHSIDINASGARSAKYADLANSYYNLALIASEQNDFEQSLKLLDTTISVASRYREKQSLVGKSHMLKASIMTALGDYEKAVSTSDLGYRLSYAGGDSEMMIYNLIEKAQAQIYMKRNTEADKTLRNALTLVKEYSSHDQLGAIYSLLAKNAGNIGKPAEVVQFYKKAFDSYRRFGDDYGCGQAAASLAYYYRFHLREHELALKEYRIALSYINNPEMRAVVYNDMSESYRDREEYEEALRLKRVAFAETGLVSHHSGLYENPSFNALRPIFDKAAFLTIIQDKAYDWLEFAKSEGKDRTMLGYALKTYMLADTMIDHMRWEHSGSVTRLFWRDKTKDMYERAIETCYLLEDTERAFYFLEKSKAILLADQLQESGAAHLLSESDRRKERDLRRKVSEWQNKLEAATDTAVTSDRASLFAAREELDIFIKSLEKTNPLYYAYKYDNKVPSVGDVRNNILKDGQVFLSYFVGDSAVYGLAIRQGKTVFKRLDLQQYNLLTGAFQGLIIDRNTQNSNFREYLRVSSALYKLLIAPFKIPEAARVVISPDGSFLSFSALSRSDSHPDFLVKHYAVSYTYSAVVLGKMQRKSAGSWFSPVFFGMAPVKFAPSLDQAPLTGSGQALRNIDRYFFRSRIAMGRDASRSEFVASSPGYRIVQLFTHASADSSGSIPTLYFADSTLRLNELSLPRKPVTELLVLSACQTGVGKNQRGEGVFSLARGFAALGIPSVLTTLWSVENEPVYRITQNLYEQISDDIPLDIALQNAQKQWLQTASTHGQLPYAWAGMVIVGNTEPVGTGIPPGRIWLFGGLILAAAGIYMARAYGSMD